MTPFMSHCRAILINVISDEIYLKKKKKEKKIALSLLRKLTFLFFFEMGFMRRIK